jgi:hypothetical protein
MDKVGSESRLLLEFEGLLASWLLRTGIGGSGAGFICIFLKNVICTTH